MILNCPEHNIDQSITRGNGGGVCVHQTGKEDLDNHVSHLLVLQRLQSVSVITLRQKGGGGSVGQRGACVGGGSFSRQASSQISTYSNSSRPAAAAMILVARQHREHQRHAGVGNGGAPASGAVSEGPPCRGGSFSRHGSVSESTYSEFITWRCSGAACLAVLRVGATGGVVSQPKGGSVVANHAQPTCDSPKGRTAN